MKNYWDRNIYSKNLNVIKYPNEFLVSFVYKKFKNINKLKKPYALEIGCGTGANCNFLNEFGFITEGFDISNKAISLAKINFPSINVFVDKIQDFNFSKKYNLIVDKMALEYTSLNTYLESFQKIKKSIVKGGYFFSMIRSNNCSELQKRKKNQ